MQQLQEVIVDFMRTRNFGEVLVLKREAEGVVEYVQASKRRQLGLNIKPTWTRTRQDAECWWDESKLRQFAGKYGLKIMNPGVLER